MSIKLLMWSLTICTAQTILLGWSNRGGEINGRGMWHVWGRSKVHTGSWWGDLRQGDHA